MQTTVEFNVEGQALKCKAMLVRVPDFVADVWESQAPGTCVGVVDEDVIRVSRVQGIMVQKLIGKKDTVGSNIAVASICNGDLMDEIPDELQMVGILDASATYLPNLLDPAYKKFLASQMVQEIGETITSPTVLSIEEAKAIEQARVQGTATDEGMFKYFKEDGVRVAHTTGGVTDAQMEAASAALFRLFEAADTDGLGLREIQQSVHLPPHHLRRLLDQLTEPQLERLGRKSVFRLKPQFRK